MARRRPRPGGGEAAVGSGGFSFTVLGGVPGGPRWGRLVTPHGEVDTPAFMPVGTQAAVKALDPAEVAAAGTRMVLCNTYHLFLRPGPEVVAAAGGLHRFMGWPGPILTDSGGFQVMSLRPLSRVEEEGVRFRSHLDGSERMLTPELSVAVQEALGADIIVPLDHCLPYPSDPLALADAAERTLRWAKRSLEARTRGDQAMFAVVQGGHDPALRAEMVRALSTLGFDGYAIGGLMVGESKGLMYRVLEQVAPLLPEGSPRYLMGVGSPDDLVESVVRGMDLFDCVLPTRLARHGTLLTGRGPVVLRNARWAREFGPPDPGCPCPVCGRFSTAYLRHLFKAGEPLGPRLASLHNLYFIQGLMSRLRAALESGGLEALRREVGRVYGPRPGASAATGSERPRQEGFGPRASNLCQESRSGTPGQKRRNADACTHAGSSGW
ncbi:MAG: tRNA guanosine(34) transglycosylase Tgt [Acetobacteraceae bacterium]|nr:tRNA guanosine(34) transglycosylase Tgt [Acetobacteraceae bacterium]